jgi:hypothetical protein
MARAAYLSYCVLIVSWLPYTYVEFATVRVWTKNQVAVRSRESF